MRATVPASSLAHPHRAPADGDARGTARRRPNAIERGRHAGRPSISDTVPSAVLATQSAPSPPRPAHSGCAHRDGANHRAALRSPGLTWVTVPEDSAGWPTPSRRRTPAPSAHRRARSFVVRLPLTGSKRTTLRSSVLATHTAPAATHTPLGLLPTGHRLDDLVGGRRDPRHACLSSVLTTQTPPSPAAIALRPRCRPGSSGSRCACVGRCRETVPLSAFTTHTAPRARRHLRRGRADRDLSPISEASAGSITATTSVCDRSPAAARLRRSDRSGALRRARASARTRRRAAQHGAAAGGVLARGRDRRRRRQRRPPARPRAAADELGAATGSGRPGSLARARTTHRVQGGRARPGRRSLGRGGSSSRCA